MVTATEQTLIFEEPNEAENLPISKNETELNEETKRNFKIEYYSFKLIIKCRLQVKKKKQNLTRK